MSTNEHVAAHFHELATLAQSVAASLSEAIAGIADRVGRALVSQNKLMFCGNGGSAADAQHLAAEYVVRFQRDRTPLSAIALTTDTSLLTAAANDLGFEHVFARQVHALGRRGDILFLHSTSGNSLNLLAAAAAARELDVYTIGVLARGGGKLAERVDQTLILPTNHAAHAQELHLAVGHVICDLVELQLDVAVRSS
jgi:D-sedoheptulose 7-phosphate isomerase